MNPRFVLLAFLALLALAPPFLPPFYVTLLNYIGLYALVALGLVLLTGVGGLTSFGQAAFVGLGAYTTAILTTRADSLPSWLGWLGASPWLTLLAGLLLTLVVAWLLGAITLCCPAISCRWAPSPGGCRCTSPLVRWKAWADIPAFRTFPPSRCSARRWTRARPSTT